MLALVLAGVKLLNLLFGYLSDAEKEVAGRALQQEENVKAANELLEKANSARAAARDADPSLLRQPDLFERTD